MNIRFLVITLQAFLIIITICASLTPSVCAQEITRDEILLAEIQKIPLIAASNITVKVKDGRVTLTGEVVSDYDSTEIQESVYHKEGVRSVYNYLIVSTLGTKTDRKLANAVMKALGSSLDLPTNDIHVEAKNGVVTLTGSVSSPTEREKVEKVARDTKGVLGVRNLIMTASG